MINDKEFPRSQQFILLVQTAALPKQMSGEAVEVAKVKVTNTDPLHIVYVALEVTHLVPTVGDICAITSQFVAYMYSKEVGTSCPSWMGQAGF